MVRSAVVASSPLAIRRSNHALSTAARGLRTVRGHRRETIASITGCVGVHPPSVPGTPST